MTVPTCFDTAWKKIGCFIADQACCSRNSDPKMAMSRDCHCQILHIQCNFGDLVWVPGTDQHLPELHIEVCYFGEEFCTILSLSSLMSPQSFRILLFCHSIFPGISRGLMLLRAVMLWWLSEADGCWGGPFSAPQLFVLRTAVRFVARILQVLFYLYSS